MPVINHIVLDPRVAVTENPIQNNLLGPVSVIPLRTAVKYLTRFAMDIKGQCCFNNECGKMYKYKLTTNR